jgi:hypothetical protein
MEPPIDFEHKKWLLLDYLQKQDNDFYNHIFSPWLLHSEKLVNSMILSYESIIYSQDKLTKKELSMENRNLFWKLSTPELPEYMNTYMEILKYSIPLMQDKISFGRKLWNDNPTPLW